MTHDDEFIDTLESYLDDYEGVTPLPDAVRDAVRATLPSTKQSGSPRGPQRIRRMTLQLPTYARYGIAAAAVVAAVAIGAMVVGPDSIGGPAASESPTPSPSPSATPAAAGPYDLLTSPDAGDLPPGDYYLDHPDFPARIEFAVPEGWWHYWDDATRDGSTVHAILVNSLDTGARDGSAWGLAFSVVDSVRADPCDESAGSMSSSVTESADAMAEAFSAWPNHPVVSVEDVTVGGYSGKRVELARGEEAVCPGTLFITPSGYEFSMELPSHEPFVNQFTFLDVEGEVLVLWTTDFPGTSQFEVRGGAVANRDAHVADQEQLREILDSIVIVPR